MLCNKGIVVCKKERTLSSVWDTQIFGTEKGDGKSSVSKSFWSDSILLYRTYPSVKISQSPFPLSNPIIYPKKILFSFQSCYTFPYGVGWVPESTITVIITQSPSLRNTKGSKSRAIFVRICGSFLGPKPLRFCDLFYFPTCQTADPPSRVPLDDKKSNIGRRERSDPAWWDLAIYYLKKAPKKGHTLKHSLFRAIYLYFSCWRGGQGGICVYSHYYWRTSPTCWDSMDGQRQLYK